MVSSRYSKKKSKISAVRKVLDTEYLNNEEINKSLGDNIDTRRNEIDIDSDLDDLQNLSDAEKEAKLLSGEAARFVASDISNLDRSFQSFLFIGHNRNSITCVDYIDDRVFYGDKSGELYCAILGTSSVTKLSPKFDSSILSVAVSDSRGKRESRSIFERTTVDTSVLSFVSAGSVDGSIGIWKSECLTFVGFLKLHRQAVTGLAFRMNTNILYSISYDAILRVWSVPEMTTLDRFYGHQNKGLSISMLYKERLVTSGEDRVLRYWKCDVGKQVEFSSQSSIIECVSMLNDNYFFAGTTSGSLLIFHIGHREPVFTYENSHGFGEIGDGTGLECDAIDLKNDSNETNSVKISNSITAIATFPFSDLGASGSYDSIVRLWRFQNCFQNNIDILNSPTADEIYVIPTLGFVTSLRFSVKGDLLFVACGKEGRLGRWISSQKSLNCIQIFGLENDTIQNLHNFIPCSSSIIKYISLKDKKSKSKSNQQKVSLINELDLNESVPENAFLIDETQDPLNPVVDERFVFINSAKASGKIISHTSSHKLDRISKKATSKKATKVNPSSKTDKKKKGKRI